MLTKVFVDVLHAISSKIPKLASLSAVQCCKFGNKWDFRGLGVTELPPLHEFGVGLPKALRHLTTLKLGLEGHALMAWREPDTGWPSDYHRPERWLNELLSPAPALENLHLCFDEVDPVASSGGERVVQGCATSTNFLIMQGFCNITLPNLKRVELSTAIVSATQLIKWLKNHKPRLDHIVLQRISVRTGPNPRDEFDFGDHYLPKDKHPTQHWPAILDCLACTTIRLSCLQETDGRVAIFNEKDLSLCAICQPPWVHKHWCYREIACEHLSFNSDLGEVPAIHAWAGLGPSIQWDKAHDTYPKRVIDREL